MARGDSSFSPGIRSDVPGAERDDGYSVGTVPRGATETIISQHYGLDASHGGMGEGAYEGNWRSPGQQTKTRKQNKARGRASQVPAPGAKASTTKLGPPFWFSDAAAPPRLLHSCEAALDNISASTVCIFTLFWERGRDQRRGKGERYRGRFSLFIQTKSRQSATEDIR